ncbi:MAG: hypothetical protein JW990_21565 [Thermoleophilia bacterium]|nr:hypothetical protein [Thermoleophilia bacterium]NLE10438.1 hypothetical protein [Actinomycetota bacterium]
MATVEIDAGVCGHKTIVTAARGEGYSVRLDIKSDCPQVQALDAQVNEVDALRQISSRGGLPSVLETAYAGCAHAACPVPSGLVKAIEVAAGLALPQDVTMRVSRD